jgi:exodeoxyribonuclease VII small subunit
MNAVGKLTSSTPEITASAPLSAPITEAKTLDQFESSLSELETLIGKMEQGGLSLDESVNSFERGMALYESCKASLDQAQLKVELLLKGASEIGAKVPFDM